MVNLKFIGSSSTHSWEDQCECYYIEDDDESESMSHRRKILQSTINLIATSSSLVLAGPTASNANANDDAQQQLTPSNFISRGEVFEIKDPNTYSAVVYIPPPKAVKRRQRQIREIESYPLLVVLHGAGTNNNEHDAIYEFTQGDHMMLPPYLLSQQTAPPPALLAENFITVAPYVGKDKRSLYDEPRSKILSFIDWFQSWLETRQVTPAVLDDDDDEEESDHSTTWSSRVRIDQTKISLFGFSEGSILAVELATTRKFNAVILASYGYTGILPPRAIERLRGIPFWIFHSTSDDVYNISCSDRLVTSLLAASAGEGSSNDIFDVRERIKYTKLITSTPTKTRREDDVSIVSGREHVRAALVASSSEDVYSWLLSL